ncbi:MAG TPA: DUF2127 domain-containing protein [Terriglobales bacterium]|nr:DUF2127 domain-containing protein [Terriglobales bacterium]
MHSGLQVEAAAVRVEHRRRLQALRTIALMELAKGIAVLAAAVSLYWVDPSDVADAFLDFLHISPDHHLAQILLHSADVLSNASMWSVILLACLYSGLRFAEAFGLWNARAWAEWIALVSGAIYIPFEVVKLAHRANLFHVSILLINLAVVAYMFYLRIYLPRLRGVIARVH